MMSLCHFLTWQISLSLSLSLFLYDEMVCVQDDVEQVLQLQYFLSYVRCLITDILVSPVSMAATH